MTAYYADPTDQYDDEIGEYHDDGDFYDTEGVPLQDNLRSPASNRLFTEDEFGESQVDGIDQGTFDDQYPRESYNAEPRSSENWGSYDQSFSTMFHQQQSPLPQVEGPDDDDGHWTDEGKIPENDDDVGKRAASKAMSMKLKIILAVSAVILGGIGGIIYWKTTAGSPPALSAQAGAPNPNDAEGLDNSTDLGGDNITNANISILEPPLSFEVTCSRESVSGDPTNFQECAEICGEAVCCYVGDTEISAGAEPCYEQNKDVCDLYSPYCDFLFGHLEFSSNSTNETNTSVSLLQPAPEDLLASCGTNGSATECMDSCYDGYCCFSSTSEILDGNSANSTSPSCYELSMCEGYFPCLMVILSSLSPANQTDFLPNPPDDLPELCSEDSLKTQIGAVQCMSHCANAMCCIDVNSTNTCIDENLALCTQYAPCSRILKGMLIIDSDSKVNQTTNASLPLPHPELANICNPDFFRKVENRTACALECQAALCCYDDVDGCLEDDFDSCMAYFPCQALIDYLGDASNITKPSANLTRNCDAESRATKAGRTECVKDCFPGLCCYHPKNSCFADDIFACLAYSPCEPIIDLDDGTFKGIVPLLNTSPGNATDVEVPPPPSDLLDKCSLDSLLSVNGVAACFGACANSYCCTSDDKNCYDSNKKNCNLYEPCLNLLYTPSDKNHTDVSTQNTTDVILEPPPDNLDSICDPDQAFTSPDCRLACEPAACCYSVDDSCRSKQPKRCKSYSPCEVFEKVNGEPLNNTIIRKVCAATAFEKNNKPCKDLCREGSCCFANVSDSDSCSNNDGFCEYYTPCEILVDDKTPTQPNTTVNATSLRKVCVPDILLNDTEAREKCADACLGWECCFLGHKNEGSCHEDVAFCKEYSPCLALSPYTNASLSLEHVCLPPNSTFTDEHMLACESLCEEGLCCLIREGDKESCAEKTNFCSAFDPCSALSASNSSASPSSMSSAGHAEHSSSHSLAPSVSPSPTSVNFTSISIAEACNTTNTSKDAARDACINVCIDGACCFLDENIPESCAKKTKFCSDYLPCAWITGASG